MSIVSYLCQLILFAVLAAAEALVAKASEAGTNQWGHDEEPHLTHGAPTVAL
jgi:hypothetical protein